MYFLTMILVQVFSILDIRRMVAPSMAHIELEVRSQLADFVGIELAVVLVHRQAQLMGAKK